MYCPGQGNNIGVVELVWHERKQETHKLNEIGHLLNAIKTL